MRFSDKVCIVTGGGSGIGRAACEQFAREGGKVLVVDVSEEGGNETVRRIQTAGSEALFARADVGDVAQVRAAVQKAVDRWGHVDVLVNNAAMMTFDTIVNLDEDKWDRLMAVNLKSVFLFCKYTLPHMPDGSAIVNVSSVHAHETTPNVIPYAASKGAMEAFARGLSQEMPEKCVRANNVAPGAVNTPMLWNNPNVKSGKEKIVGEIGEPEDIAAAICFLASSEAKYIDGTTLVVDGGRLDVL